MDLATNLDDTIFRVTGIYGPSNQQDKQDFFDELKLAQPPNNLPWILLGDLNVTLQPSDRPSNRNHHAQMSRFRALIDHLQLLDLRLQGRTYTWSNDRDNPAFARLDRFLISTSWSNIFPKTIQRAITNTASDHCPIVCESDTKFPNSNVFRIENSWLKNHYFQSMVAQLWDAHPLAQNPTQLSNKLTALRRGIIAWKKEFTTEQRQQTTLCKECLHWLSQQSEKRALT